MTPSLCLFSILRINKAGLFDLQITPCVSFMNRIRLCYRTFFLMDLQIDICMYICIFERDNLIV